VLKRKNKAREVKKATIKDIARRAGVSATTVSLALNHSPRISRATQERVARVAQELRYRPNYVARSLVSRRSHTLGLVLTTITNPFYPELAKGIEDKATQLGYSIILCSTNYDAYHQKRLVDMLRSKGVDGIIFTSVEVNDPNIKLLLDDGFPFVLVNRRVHKRALEPKIDYVVMDNVLGGYMAVQHLYQVGYRRIAIVAGSFATSTAIERTQGAKKAMADYGLQVEGRLIVDCSFSKEKAYRATRELLLLPEPPTAIFAQNDYMALGVREAILDSGRRIPDDIGLIGFDDIEASGIRGVELTTINQKKYEMGGLAVEILIDKIENKTAAARHIVLRPEIVVRNSCGLRHRAQASTDAAPVRVAACSGNLEVI
jgi:LacI family transcriptional regulator